MGAAGLPEQNTGGVPHEDTAGGDAATPGLLLGGGEGSGGTDTGGEGPTMVREEVTMEALGSRGRPSEAPLYVSSHSDATGEATPPLKAETQAPGSKCECT